MIKIAPDYEILEQSAEFINSLNRIVGEKHVLSSEDLRRKHSLDTIPYTKVCSAVVYPSTAEEVQAIMKIANEYKAEVWVFSRGNNWGYGTKMALEHNTIILVLERMNRIIEVNAELAYAIVEPGVSQKQLNDYLQEHYIKLWTDCTDSTPNGSVLGNSIERGFGYTPYGDHFASICGLEVVLPDGGMIRTGGEHGNVKTWNTHKWGSGPYIEGLFSQSNLGVVVKAGIWLMPEPECFNAFTFEILDEKYLPNVLDSIRDLSLDNTIQCHTHMANQYQMLSLLRQYPYDLLNGEKRIPDTLMAQFKKEFNIPFWSLVGGLYGSKAVVKANRSKVKNVLSKFGRIEFFDEQKIKFAKKFINLCQNAKKGSLSDLLGKMIRPLISAKPIEVMRLLPEFSKILKGIPTETIVNSAYFKAKQAPPKENLNPAEDNCGIMWLAPAVAASGSEGLKALSVVKPLYAKHGFDFAACFTLMSSRTYFFLLGIFFDQENQEEKNRAMALFQDLSKATKAAGFVPYRLGVTSMDKFMEEDPELGNFFSKIKTALDPNSILSPGKYSRNKKGGN